ncbi:hypothetical protein O181_078601 [Austropuccinia psidii MF-1]|uniref:Integrase catalytic domain-containing protein n=1 Tax=Austropuccinia psidii MF-1 TaxID=1389203 RepID=A0A9Q3ID71_9BASI|nr:hypothetical protein [Austropuccinia psidii MF-1]
MMHCIVRQYLNNRTHACLLRNDRWFLDVRESANCNEISECSDETSRLMHRRLAHLSLRLLRRMQKLKCVMGLPPKLLTTDVKICRACSLAKSRHTPLDSPSRWLVEQPGDVIVADLMGPFPLSFDKRAYAMLIQDHYSSLVTMYPLKTKSEAGGCLIDWIKKFNNLTNFSVKRVRTDNAGELNTNTLKNFFAEIGIIHEKIVPYEHHQAGKIERTNRTIAKAARSQLIDADLPATLWSYAFRQAVWIFNWVPHKENSKTPYELVVGRKPDITPLRVFGCKAFVHNLNHRKDLSPKARELIHIGIAEDSKGWVFWDRTSGTVYRSATAIFDETERELRVPAANAIEITNLFDPTMLQEMGAQDEALQATAAVCHLVSDSPSSYREAMNGVEKEKWAQAMKEELLNLKNMLVWEPAAGDKLKQALGCRWVYMVKRNQQGEVIRYKARLVVQGHRQIKGLNFEETFAPTPTFTSLRCLLAIASALRWELQTFDVTTAYLHSQLEEDIYVKAPEGATSLPGILKLNKALYGLKQAGRCWWNHLKNILNEVGLTPNPEDQSTYVYDRADGRAMLWIHVDDGVLGASNKKLLDKLKLHLEERLKLKWDNTLGSIVGIEIKKEGNTFKLCQPQLIKKVCDITPSNITAMQPMPDMKLTSGKAERLDKEYLSRIGMLLYVAQATRPDIMYSVNYLARFSMNTNQQHWTALNHLINYLQRTSGRSLSIAANTGEDTLSIFVDANWGGEGSRSQHGYMGFLWGAPVMWNSKRQTCVA